ncbi:MAG: TolC family protein [Archangiaceae bacterium]|nr:TolC family protein [Archangiaceae bacterium]
MRGLVVILFSTVAVAEEGLSLDAALSKAMEQVPALKAARSQELAAQARARESFAPLLPQVSLGLQYSRSTANFVARPGAVPTSLSGASNLSLDSFDFFSGNVSAQILVWDFFSTWNRHQAAKRSAEGQAAQTKGLELTTALNVRTAYFSVKAQEELVAVTKAALDNTQAHLTQIQAFVAAGARPEIDLAQARAEVANAKLAHLNAKNAVALARARLAQSMGVKQVPDSLTDGPPGALDAEDATLEALVTEGVKARPEAAQLEAAVQSQELSLAAVKGTYWPTLSAQLSTNAQARQLSAIVPNVSGQLSLSWQLYQGGLTQAQQAESEATLAATKAQVETLEQQVRLDVEQAQLDVHAAREGLDVAAEAKTASGERLRLAEGRYQAGAGSIIELSDAQVAFTQAGAQVAQAGFTLAAARARLLAALGRER